VDAPGRLLAAGRDSDIFEYGDGRVLRRSRTSRSLATEAAVMSHVRSHGYPAPAVHDLRDDGRELVIDRVDGPDMATALTRRPWTMWRYAAVLAHLHERLHAIPALEGLPPGPDGGNRQLHLDLHPLNVLLSPTGPVVIDWTNAARGDPETDLAFTWVIIGASEVDGGPVERAVVWAFRGLFLRAFLAQVDRPAVVARIRAVAERRVLDPNIRPTEVEAVWRLVEAAEATAAGSTPSSRRRRDRRVW
jgi:aminoglycoside phosphotransferase (APT) family kinase protein